MLNSKILTIFRIFCLAAVTVSISSCFKPGKNQFNEDAQFYLSNESSGKIVYLNYDSRDLTKSQSNVWKYPRMARVKLKTCLRDTLQNTLIRNNEFNIQVNGKWVSATTLENGCLTWIEELPFNYLADAQYLWLERTIKGNKIYKGSLRVNIVINPWAQRDKTKISVLYPKFNSKFIQDQESVKDPLKILAALRGEGQSKTILSDQIVGKLVKGAEHNKSNEFSFSINSVEIYVITKDVIGKEKKFPLDKSGKYLVQSRLYEKHQTNIDMIPLDNLGSSKIVVYNTSQTSTKSLTQKIVKIPSGPLKVDFQKEFQNNWTNGYLVAFLSVNPLDYPYPDFLLPMTRAFSGGLVKSIASDAKYMRYMKHFTESITKSTSKKDFKYYLTSGDKKDSQKKKKNAFEVYYVDPMSPRFLQIQRGETSTARTINYSVKTCLTNTSTSLPPNPGEKFEITVLNEFNEHKEVFISEANQRGCISWVGDIYHKIYLPERLFNFDIKIKELSSGATNIKKLGYSINPWGNNLVFGTDYYEINDKYRKNNNERVNIRTRFFIPNFTYTALRFRYAIDEFLNVTVKKTVLMHLYPKVLRYNSRVDGRYSVYPLRDGVYLLKAALDKHYLDPAQKGISIHHNNKGLGKEGRHYFKINGQKDLRRKHSLTTAKKLVRVINGEIITPIEFDVSDLRIMRIRSQVVFQIDSIDEQRLWMINYYDTLYESYLKKAVSDQKIDELTAENMRSTEKLKNLEKIANVMKNDDFFIENYLIQKSQILLGRKGKFKNEMYDYCDGEVNVNWRDLFKVFSLQQNQLQNLYSKNISDLHYEDNFDRLTNILQFEIKKGKYKECLQPFNILRDLQISEIVANRISPIRGFNLDHLIDSSMGYENDHTNTVPREAFTGPVTFLLNGNASSLRTTRNIAEGICKESSDCDEMSLNASRDKFVTSNDRNHYKYVYRNKNYGYERSKYFNSIKYMNNVLVDDLIKKNVHKDILRYRENLVRSQIYYYLYSNNLRFLSLEKETPQRVDLNRCSDLLESKNFERDCLVKDSSLNIDNEDLYKNDSPVIQNIYDAEEDMTEYIQKVYGEYEPQDTAENQKSSTWMQLSTAFFGPRITSYFSGEKTEETSEEFYSKKRFAMKRSLSEKICTYFLNRDGSSKGILEKVKGGTGKYFNKCVKQLMYGERSGILDLERKVRVEETGRYFYKNGKSQNINVSSDFNYSFSEEFSTAWNYAFGGSIDTSRFATNLLGMVSGKLGVSFDKRWSKGSANKLGDGISVGTSTYLVMQTAQMDVMITRYKACVTMGYSREFLENKDVQKRFLEYSVQEGQESAEKSQEILSNLKSGLLVCDRSVHKDLPIREDYYYLTQHFTEGDMLDAGDIFNHPWLLMIRGRSDMWRFMQQVKARPYGGKLNAANEEQGVIARTATQLFSLQGSIVRNSATWPLEQLMKSYETIYPSFPSIYTMVHLTEPRSFPWADQPGDSFTTDWLEDEEDASSFEKLTTRSNIHALIAEDRQAMMDQSKDNKTRCDLDIEKIDSGVDLTDADTRDCVRETVPVVEFVNDKTGKKRTLPLSEVCPEKNCSEVHVGEDSFLEINP